MNAKTKALLGLLTVVGILSAQTGASAQTSSPTASEATDLEKVVAYTQPSVVYLDITWVGWVYDTFNKGYLNDAKPFVLQYSCTGFFVNPDGHLATAGHCVDKQSITSDFFDVAAGWALENKYYESNTLTYEDIRGFADDDYRLEGEGDGSGGRFTPGADLTLQAVWDTESTEELYDNSGELNGDVHDARLVKLIPWDDGEGDTAIVKVETDDVVIPLPLTQEEVVTGTEVTAIGYPGSVMDVSDTALSDPSFKEGSVSSVRSNATYPVYEIDASMSGGMSGGPTVNPLGQVVGVNSYSHVDEVSEFHFVQASSTLDQLMVDAGVTSELGEAGTAYRAGLDAYFAGDKATAVSELETAVGLAPDLVFAQEYLTQAQALPDPVPPDEGSSLPIVPIVIGVIVIGAIVAGLMVARGRKAKTSAGVSTQPPPNSAHSVPTPPVTTPVTTPALSPLGRPTEAEVETAPVMTQERRFCESCGSHVSAGARFCPSCGQEQ